MKKIVINACYGGFSLSPEATLRLYELGGPVKAWPVEEYFKDAGLSFGEMKNRLAEWRNYLAGKHKGRGLFLSVFSPDEKFVLDVCTDDRSNPLLVQVVEELGKKADGACAALKVVEVPNNVDYVIEEYDGSEWVAEKHRTWS